jgi:hypothetical protein
MIIILIKSTDRKDEGAFVLYELFGISHDLYGFTPACQKPYQSDTYSNRYGCLSLFSATAFEYKVLQGWVV